MDKDRDNGLIHLPSQHAVDDIVQRLQILLSEKNIKLFAVVDHSGEAEKAGLQMPPTKLLIFGNPKAGTPLMQATPTVAIDLPLKALVWEDGDGKVWLTYNDPAYLQHRHGFPEQLVASLSAVNGLLAKAVE
jgi:uncharacterized protein (DUF302 family)